MSTNVSKFFIFDTCDVKYNWSSLLPPIDEEDFSRFKKYSQIYNHSHSIHT